VKSATRNPQSALVGLDIGGTKMAGGVVLFPEGQVLARRQVATLPERGGEPVLADALKLAAQLVAEANALGHDILGLGVGVCELVDPHGQVTSDHCVKWRGLPAQERFARLAPTVVEADSRAAALGEALLGAGRECASFFYVTIGTGIGSALVLDGVPYVGARGSTGTLASSPLPCVRCGEGQSPTLEEYASGPALLARYLRRQPGRANRTEDVLRLASEGDRDAAEVVSSAATALGGAIALMVNVLDPGAVIVGGSLGLAGALYWEALVGSVRRHIWSETHRELPIDPAALGAEAGWIGAAACAWRRHRPADSPPTR
jgi:glucokinase